MNRPLAFPCVPVCAAALATFLFASSAAAQACLGYPAGTTGALRAGFSFPEGATGYSLSGLVGSQQGFAFLEASFGVVAPEADGLENTKVAGASVAFEILALAPEVSLCPAGGFSVTWVRDNKALSVPFGVGVGVTLPFRGEIGVTPFAVPQFIYVREEIEGFDEAASDVFVGLAAGVTANVGPFFVTGAVTKVVEEETPAVFSVAVGAAWR